jgi:adenylate kinase family enzyme
MKTVTLIGYRGSGKSTVAAPLAAPFVKSSLPRGKPDFVAVNGR